MKLNCVVSIHRLYAYGLIHARTWLNTFGFDSTGTYDCARLRTLCGVHLLSTATIPLPPPLSHLSISLCYCTTNCTLSIAFYPLLPTNTSVQFHSIYIYTDDMCIVDEAHSVPRYAVYSQFREFAWWHRQNSCDPQYNNKVTENADRKFVELD